MTMEEPVSREELEGQARIRHADGLELVSGVYKSVIEEVWAAYEKGRGEAQLRYEEESAELLEILNEELEVIAAGPGDPGPVPEVEPDPAADPIDLGDGWTARPVVDVPGPGTDPGDEPICATLAELRDLMSILASIGRNLARSAGEGKIIDDGLSALAEAIEARGSDDELVTMANTAINKTEVDNHEIDQGSG